MMAINVDPAEEDAILDKYFAQVARTGGFEVDKYKMVVPGMITPEGDGGDKETIAYSKLALKHFNLSEGTDFKFDQVLHQNAELVRGDVFYITFLAKSRFAGSTLTFQLEVWKDIPGRNKELPIEFLSCRLKPGQVFVRHVPPEKRQKITQPSALAGDIDVSALDKNYEWLGKVVVNDNEEYNVYRNQVLHSKGFFVDEIVPLMFTGQIVPLETFEFEDKLVPVLAELALEHYTFLRADAECRYEEIVFSCVENANVQTDSLRLHKAPFKAKNANFYITFVANNNTDNTVLFLRTLIWKRVLDNDQLRIIVMFVQLIKETPFVDLTSVVSGSSGRDQEEAACAA